MATMDPVPCNTCGMLPSQCSCSVWARVGGKTYTYDSSSTQSYVPMTGTGAAAIPRFVDNGWQGQDHYTYSWTSPALGCTNHSMDPESIKLRDGEIHGVCSNCKNTIVVPHIVGGFAFEEAGTLLGQAIALDPEDEAQLGELLAELNILEQKIAKEQARYRTTLGMIKIAREKVTGRISEGSTIE